MFQLHKDENCFAPFTKKGDCSTYNKMITVLFNEHIRRLLKKCNKCRIRTDKSTFKENKTVCKSRYNKNKRRNDNNILMQIQNQTSSGNEISGSQQQLKIDINNNNNNSLNLVIGFWNCVNTYIKNYFLLQ